MKHLFVPYELALKLKEKGFNEKCLSFFYKKKDGTFRLNEEYMPHTWWTNLWFTEEVWAATQYEQKDKDFIKNVAAPLYQQVIDYFREKHNIPIGILYVTEEERNQNPILYPKPYKYYFSVYQNDDIVYMTRGEDYYEALNKAIEEALKLI